ncbi:nicotinate-nucleotide adenylyltransferase [Mariniflexile sp.]|uniref:nicotinate-nucleotide adenylyltransferase n=1 Tax=Mariniflexile sp. TaxID=1979402 RepID=UPI003563441D
MRKIIFGFFIFGLTFQVQSQTIELTKTVIASNYQYHNAIETHEAPQPVKKLEDAVLNYKTTELCKLFESDKDIYTVKFTTQEGEIVAAYNKKGEIINTIEKYNNVRLPLAVMQAIATRFPNWGIVEGIYLVKYKSEQDLLNQQYKLKIKNENQVITVNTDPNGVFL